MARERAVEVDLANERVILATIAREAGWRRKLSQELDAECFGDPRHKVLFRAISAISKRGLEWSEDAVMELAGGEDFGGFRYLRKLLEEYESSPNVPFHVERLRLDGAKFQGLTELLPKIQADYADKEASAASIAAKHRAAANAIESAQAVKGRRGEKLAELYYDELRQRRITGDVIEGTGFRQLDKKLARGLVTGLSALVGRPGHGKTTFAANLISNRLEQSKATYLCAWEMLGVDYLDMIVASKTGIAAVDLARKVREFTDEDAEAVQEAARWITESDYLAIEQNPFPGLPKIAKPWEANERNLDHFEATISREASRYPVFVVDVFSKLLADRRPDAISEALIRVRSIAIRYGVHVCLLHHLNRDGADKAPSLETIKGAGAWEEECDLILGIDRPLLRAPPGRRKKMTDVLDCHVLKQRKGPAPLIFRYEFDGPHFRLANESVQDVSVIAGEDD